MSLSFSRSILVAIVLVGVGIGLAALFVVQRLDATRIDDFYLVADSLVDQSKESASYVYFVRVESYDTSKMARVADRITNERVLADASVSATTRDIHILFFVPTDTSSLTPDEVEDLAYTNRQRVDPLTTLVAVRGGYQLRARFAPNSKSPAADVLLTPSPFYRPRAGVRASDLREH